MVLRSAPAAYMETNSFLISSYLYLHQELSYHPLQMKTSSDETSTATDNIPCPKDPPVFLAQPNTAVLPHDHAHSHTSLLFCLAVKQNTILSELRQDRC